MLPPISQSGALKPEKPEKESSNKLRWQKSTRRISYVKLPSINNAVKGKTAKPVAEEPSTSKPSAPTPPLPPMATITPSLCIDNQYFANYINEKPKWDDVEYLSRGFREFAKVQGEFHAQRTNYFDKRGLLAALEINIDQQNEKISEALGCLSVCNEMSQRYHCSLETSFEKLVEDFAEKAFHLTSLTCQLHSLKETQSANHQVRKNEENQLEEIAWRIEREERRIRKLDEKLRKFYENREKKKNGAKVDININ